MNLIKYKEILEQHRRALAQIELDLGFFIDDSKNLNIFKVESRLKDYKSAISKSLALGIDVENLDDLAGLRIIVATKSELNIIEHFFTRQEYSKNITILKRHDLNKKSGYRAIHLVIELKPNALRSFYGGRLEIQLQTIFGNAFNNLSRSWLYKADIELNKEWNNKFIELSNTLNKLENIAEDLHKEIIEASSDNDLSPLTPHSYILIVKKEFNEDINYKDAVDSCHFYSKIGCTTNADLRSFFSNKKIIELYDFVINNAPESEALRVLLSMGKTGFWSIFGTRIDQPNTKDFITASLIKPNKHIDDGRGDSPRL